MAKGEVLGGDFPKGHIIWDEWGILKVGFMAVGGQPLDVASVELVTEESRKKFFGAAGLGLAGGLALGPVGALAGILAGGNKKEVCFVCTITNGSSFLARSDPQLYQKFVAAALKSRPHSSPPETKHGSGKCSVCNEPYPHSFKQCKCGAMLPWATNPQQSTSQAPDAQQSDSKKCPNCAEDIKADAKKCRYCGEWL